MVWLFNFYGQLTVRKVTLSLDYKVKYRKTFLERSEHAQNFLFIFPDGEIVSLTSAFRFGFFSDITSIY